MEDILHNKRGSKLLFFSLIAANLFLLGCSGGGGDSQTQAPASTVVTTNVATKAYTVSVVDDSIIGATVSSAECGKFTENGSGSYTLKECIGVPSTIQAVGGFIDLDGNGVQDANETSQTAPLTLKVSQSGLKDGFTVTPLTTLASQETNLTKLAQKLGLNEADLFKDDNKSRNLQRSINTMFIMAREAGITNFDLFVKDFKDRILLSNNNGSTALTDAKTYMSAPENQDEYKASHGIVFGGFISDISGINLGDGLAALQSAQGKAVTKGKIRLGGFVYDGIIKDALIIIYDGTTELARTTSDDTGRYSIEIDEDALKESEVLKIEAILGKTKLIAYITTDELKAGLIGQKLSSGTLEDLVISNVTTAKAVLIQKTAPEALKDSKLMTESRATVERLYPNELLTVAAAIKDVVDNNKSITQDDTIELALDIVVVNKKTQVITTTIPIEINASKALVTDDKLLNSQLNTVQTIDQNSFKSIFEGKERYSFDYNKGEQYPVIYNNSIFNPNGSTSFESLKYNGTSWIVFETLNDPIGTISWSSDGKTAYKTLDAQRTQKYTLLSTETISFSGTEFNIYITQNEITTTGTSEFTTNIQYSDPIVLDIFKDLPTAQQDELSALIANETNATNLSATYTKNMATQKAMYQFIKYFAANQDDRIQALVSNVVSINIHGTEALEGTQAIETKVSTDLAAIEALAGTTSPAKATILNDARVLAQDADTALNAAKDLQAKITAEKVIILQAQTEKNEIAVREAESKVQSLFEDFNTQLALAGTKASAVTSKLEEIEAYVEPTVDFTTLHGQSIYFQNIGGAYGIRTFDQNGTTVLNGVSQFAYSTNDNTLTIIRSATSTLSLTFNHDDNLSAVKDLEVAVRSLIVDENNNTISDTQSTSTWNTAIPVPEEFLNVEISYLNTNGAHGTRTFGTNGIVTGVSGLAGQEAQPYIEGYIYNPETREITIRNGSRTIVLILPSDDDLSALPVSVTLDANPSTIVSPAGATTKWTISNSVNVIALKASINGLTDSPTNLASVTDAKTMFNQLREATNTFLDLEQTLADQNSSTILGSQVVFIDTKLRPAVEDIASDFNTSAYALEDSLRAFSDSITANFANTLGTATTEGTLESKFNTISTLMSNNTNDSNWTLPVNGDLISYTYSENNTTGKTTESMGLNGKTVTMVYETDGEGFDVDTVVASGDLLLTGNDYNVSITAFNFTNDKATFKAKGKLTGLNNASMELSTLDITLDANRTLEGLSVARNVSLFFEGNITSDSRVLDGSITLNEVNASVLSGSYTGLTSEPKFVGTVTLQTSLNTLIDDLEKADNDSDVWEDEALLMAIFSDGSKSFVTTIAHNGTTPGSTGVERTEHYSFSTQTGTNLTCTRTVANTTHTDQYAHTRIDTISNTVSCDDGASIEAYYSDAGNLKLVFDNSKKVTVNYAKFNTFTTYLNVDANFYFQTNTDGSSIMTLDGENVIVTSIEYTEPVNFLDRKFDIKMNGTLTHASRSITTIVGINKDLDTKINAKDVEITDGESFVQLQELNVVMTNSEFLKVTNDSNEDDYNDIYNHTFGYSRFENYNVNLDTYHDRNDLNITHIKHATLKGFQTSLTDSDNEKLTVNADIVYTYNDRYNLVFDGDYAYRDTTFTGHIDVDGNEFTEIINGEEDKKLEGTANVFGSISANGFKPFTITSNSVLTTDSVLNSNTLLSRDSTYLLGLNISSNDNNTTVKLGDSNGVLTNTTYLETDNNPTLQIVNKNNESLADFGEALNGNEWEIKYSDNTSETIF